MCGLDPTKYKGHSFRIGTATFAQNVAFLMPKFGLWVGGYPTPLVSIFGVQVCAQPLRLLGRDRGLIMAVKKHFFWQTHLLCMLKLLS